MVGKDNRLVRGEHGVELAVGQPMRMFARGLEGHKIDHIDDADSDVREMPAQQIHGRKGLECWDISGTGHHDIGLASPVGRGPLPDPDSVRAMHNS